MAKKSFFITFAALIVFILLALFAIDGINSIIEPVMSLIMGSMVGLIAASVMGPIAGLAQSIKG